MSYLRSSDSVDAAALAAFLVLAGSVLSVFKLPLLAAAALIYVAPSLYLAARKKKQLKRDAAAAVLLGPVFGFLVDFFGQVNGAWSYGAQWFLLPGGVAGVPADILVWVFFWSLFIVFFYEHFFEKDASEALSGNYAPALIFSVLGAAALVAAVFAGVFDPRVPYAYLVWGALSLGPLAAVWLLRSAAVARSIALAGAFLVVPNVLFEAAGLHAGYWRFAGEYAAVLELFGRTLPLEELLFWIVLSPAIVLCNFELFVRKGR